MQWTTVNRMADNTNERLTEDLTVSATDWFLTLPFAGTIMGRMMGAVCAEWARNGSKALAVAQTVSGLSREDLAESIAQSPELIPLHTRLLYAAGMTGHDGTLRSMGAVLGDAVKNSDRINECELILTALTDLTPAHTQLLQVLSTDPPQINEKVSLWYVDNLEERSGLPPSVVPLCLAAIVGRGLAATEPVYDLSFKYTITALGRTVLGVLEDWSGAVN
jgi:hypothetical protein